MELFHLFPCSIDQNRSQYQEQRQTHEKYTPHFSERSGNMQYKNGKERKERRKKISRKGQRTEANKMTFHITDGLQ